MEGTEIFYDYKYFSHDLIDKSSPIRQLDYLRALNSLTVYYKESTNKDYYPSFELAISDDENIYIYIFSYLLIFLHPFFYYNVILTSLSSITNNMYDRIMHRFYLYITFYTCYIIYLHNFVVQKYIILKFNMYLNHSFFSFDIELSITHYLKQYIIILVLVLVFIFIKVQKFSS